MEGATFWQLYGEVSKTAKRVGVGLRPRLAGGLIAYAVTGGPG